MDNSFRGSNDGGAYWLAVSCQKLFVISIPYSKKNSFFSQCGGGANAHSPWDWFRLANGVVVPQKNAKLVCAWAWFGQHEVRPRRTWFGLRRHGYVDLANLARGKSWYTRVTTWAERLSSTAPPEAFENVVVPCRVTTILDFPPFLVGGVGWHDCVVCGTLLLGISHAVNLGDLLSADESIVCVGRTIASKYPGESDRKERVDDCEGQDFPWFIKVKHSFPHVSLPDGRLISGRSIEERFSCTALSFR